MDCAIIMSSNSLRKRFGRAVMIQAAQEDFVLCTLRRLAHGD